MYSKTLNRFRELILHKTYVVTIHAYDEMSADDLSIWDVESVILTGNIEERQRDAATNESKYRIRGNALDGALAEVLQNKE